MVDIRELVDARNGTQSRRIFWDQDIYELEMERIFARCWLFLTHESLIPNPGDFTLAKMGQDEVIVLRQRDGSIKAFLNQCTHRGMRLCMAEAGNAKGFSCNYHGWGFGIDGQLKGVPAENEVYGPRFDKKKLGLRPVPQVDSHRGFIFGSMDPQAPGLRDYLGETADLMDIWADVPGGIEFLGPPARSLIPGNWKVGTENFVGDAYHVFWSHASINSIIAPPGFEAKWFAGPEVGVQLTSRFGHGMGIAYGAAASTVGGMCPDINDWHGRRAAEMATQYDAHKAKLYAGHWDAAIFPNITYLFATNVFKVWNPVGPNQIELLSWVWGEKQMPEELKRKARAATHRAFGTAGTLESDDVDNYEYCNRANEGFVTRQGTLSCQMGIGEEREDPAFPGFVTGNFLSETAYRGFYQFYAECLASDSWDSLQANTADWKRNLLP